MEYVNGAEGLKERDSERMEEERGGGGDRRTDGHTDRHTERSTSHLVLVLY